MITQQANPQVFNPEEFLNKFESFESFTVSHKGEILPIGKIEALHSFLICVHQTLEIERNTKVNDDEKFEIYSSYADRNILENLRVMIGNYCYIIEKKEINISKLQLTDAEEVLKSTIFQCLQYMSSGAQSFITSSSIRVILSNAINFVFTMFVTRTKNLKGINNYLNIV
jgi:hypothetical protein